MSCKGLDTIKITISLPSLFSNSDRVFVDIQSNIFYYFVHGLPPFCLWLWIVLLYNFKPSLQKSQIIFKLTGKPNISNSVVKITCIISKKAMVSSSQLCQKTVKKSVYSMTDSDKEKIWRPYYRAQQILFKDQGKNRKSNKESIQRSRKIL